MELIDSHCHFDFEQFSPDRAAVWKRCQEVGVGKLVIPGVSVSQWQSLFALLQGCPDWYGAVGVHPWWVRDLDASEEELKQQLLQWGHGERCIAVGECGLDRAIDTPLERQQAVLRVHLAAAAELQLPVILHVHRYHAELLAMLKEFHLPRGGVIHAFSGSEEIAREYWKQGFYLGIGGTITYPRAAKTRRSVAAAPLESLVLESDAPDMPLNGRQGERNSPEYLPEILAELARLREMPVEEVAVQARRNTERLFAL
ncbi:TatD family hydrolase [Microbulbifer yueqingensis]|uniref:TatD DNase family protein n=1 Tax=Microbulbifer yueqingensis TaxID=658219 RepID=A0A1G9AIM2_9GAMM|nr:TatD family hydrolase [Microbulbifer yueqingensis]SDK27108.1 TatD DNase family protein [Microbulbifer yueqingensis]